MATKTIFLKSEKAAKVTIIIIIIILIILITFNNTITLHSKIIPRSLRDHSRTVAGSGAEVNQLAVCVCASFCVSACLSCEERKKERKAKKKREPVHLPPIIPPLYKYNNFFKRII